MQSMSVNKQALLVETFLFPPSSFYRSAATLCEAVSAQFNFKAGLDCFTFVGLYFY